MAQTETKRNKKAIWMVLAILCIVVLCGMLGYQLLRVNKIEVEGNQSIPDEAVIALSGIKSGEKMLDVKSEAVGEALSANPYLEFQRIERKFPDTLVIHVSERTALAKVPYLSAFMLIDEQAVLLETVDATNLTLEVTGLQISDIQPGKKLACSDSLQIPALVETLTGLQQAKMMDLVTGINMQDPVDIRLYTTSGIEIRLGTSSEIENKVAWIQSVLPELVKQGKQDGLLDVSSGRNASYSPAEQ